MSVAQQFAERICSLDWADLDDVARNNARVAIADALGCTLAGWPEPCTQVAARVLGAFPTSGPCAVVGSSTRTGPLEAAFINGTACHALDFDDCNNTVGGHPTAPILFGALAMGEVLQASGRELMVAYAAGFETMAKLARAVHFHHYRKGWHPTATLGVFGATAACARLLSLDVSRTAQALSHAASLSAGIKANFGTMTKPLHVGHANRNGLFAAQMAAAGMSAGEQAFEHPQGFFDVFNGAGTYDVSRSFDGWADPLDIADPGVAIKAYPCCGSTHPAIDAAIALREELNLDRGDVVAIHSRTHERRLQHTNRPKPNGALDAKFSVQYVVARALASGQVGLGDFYDACWEEPVVKSLMDKVSVSAHQEDNHFCAYLDIETRGGVAHSKFIPTPLGRDASNPLPRARLRAKFDDCCTISIDAGQAASLWDSVWNLDALDNIRNLSRFLQGGSPAFSQIADRAGEPLSGDPQSLYAPKSAAEWT